MVDFNRNCYGQSDSQTKQKSLLRTTTNRLTSHYSKQDILDQYCITNKPFEYIDNQTDNFFGCLSANYRSWSLSSNSKHSFFTICLRHKIPSDEYLYHNRALDVNAVPNYLKKTNSDCNYQNENEDLSHFILGKKKINNNLVISDESSVKQSCLTQQGFSNREKHVSFARSHTLASFDDSTFLSPVYLARKKKANRPSFKSEERLLDGKKTVDWNLKNSQHLLLESSQFSEKLKKSTMKAQATQTEVAEKTQMEVVDKIRKLLKSQSENYSNDRKSDEHDALLRTYSEQPVKSYNDNREFMISNRLQFSACSESNELHDSDNESDHYLAVTNYNITDVANINYNSDKEEEEHHNDNSNDNENIHKEIFIDFKPNSEGIDEDMGKEEVLAAKNKNFLHLLLNYQKQKNNSDSNDQQICDFVFSSFSDSVENEDDNRKSIVLTQSNSIDDDDFHEKYVRNDAHSETSSETNNSLKIKKPDGLSETPSILDSTNIDKVNETLSSTESVTLKRKCLLLMKEQHQDDNENCDNTTENRIDLDKQKQDSNGRDHIELTQCVSTPITDVSESTTTTVTNTIEEYVTANSDSSKFSSYKTAITDYLKIESSSFESTTTSTTPPKVHKKTVDDDDSSTSSGSYTIEPEIDSGHKLKLMAKISKSSSKSNDSFDGFYDLDSEMVTCSYCGTEIDAVCRDTINTAEDNRESFESSQFNGQLANSNQDKHPDQNANQMSTSFDFDQWVFIGDIEEYKMWLSRDALDVHTDNSGAIKNVELDFQRRYRTLCYRMIHRKASLEMYKRLESNTFDCNNCVTIRKSHGEFGVRIHGSRPVVVTAIEPHSAAEKSGLTVGDILIDINSVDLTNKNHSETVKIANSSCDVINLKLVNMRTSIFDGKLLKNDVIDSDILFGSYLWKLNRRFGDSDNSSKWLRRWFCLKSNCYLYQYRNKTDTIPLSIIIMNDCDLLLNEKIETTSDSKLYRICIKPRTTPILHLASNKRDAIEHFQTILQSLIRLESYSTIWLKSVNRSLNSNPEELFDTDYVGYLLKLDDKMSTWVRIYAILKQACFYVYENQSANKAVGFITLLGYKVRLSNICGKRHVFELCPTSDSKLDHFYLFTDNEMERKKLFAALEYSIDKWFRI